MPCAPVRLRWRWCSHRATTTSCFGSAFIPVRSWPACRTSSPGSKASTAPPFILRAGWSIWPSPATFALTESTFKLVQAFCDARALGHQDVKGFPRPIAVYRLVGMKPSRAPFRDAVVSTYRGRNAELAILQEAFAGAEQGAGKAIGISAPPGLGKSRLCSNLPAAPSSVWCRCRK